MPFNPSDYIKPLPNEIANDREVYNDETDRKINDLRQDVINAFLAFMASGATPGPNSVTAQMIAETPATGAPPVAPNLVPPSINPLAPPMTTRIVYVPSVSSTTDYIATNASWNGSTWVADDGTKDSFAISVSSSGMKILKKTAPSTTWTNWSSEVSFDLNGNIIAAGPTTCYWAYHSQVTTGATVGTAANFKKFFPSTPSSFVFGVLASQNIDVGIGAILTAYETTHGCGVILSVTGTGEGYVYGTLQVS